MEAPTLYTKFEGGWCDNCRTAWSFIPRNGMCPSCGPVPLVTATITVDVHHLAGETYRPKPT